MLKIILCCSAAMSTSLLVEKMMVEANKCGIQTYIWASGVHDIEDNKQDADIILIAPQIKYAKKEIEKAVSPIPVMEISVKDFGLMDAKNILNHAIETIHTHTKEE